jgi:hypothetical protein
MSEQSQVTDDRSVSAIMYKPFGILDTLGTLDGNTCETTPIE